MTLAQVRMFAAASDRRCRRQLRDQALNIRAAQYDKNTFEWYLKNFDE